MGALAHMDSKLRKVSALETSSPVRGNCIIGRQFRGTMLIEKLNSHTERFANEFMNSSAQLVDRYVFEGDGKPFGCHVAVIACVF